MHELDLAVNMSKKIPICPARVNQSTHSVGPYAKSRKCAAVFPRSQSSRLLSSLSSSWTWAGGWDLPVKPNKCSLRTFLTFLDLSLRQTLTTKFPLTRPSPRQCTAERLRIQQGDCFSWSEDPSPNYPKRFLSHCTVPYCGHTWSRQWKPTPQH